MSQRFNRNPGQREKLVNAVWAFDPVGIRGSRMEIPDEYDSIADGLMFHLASGASDRELNRWVRSELAVEWGAEYAAADLEKLVHSARLAWARVENSHP